MKTWKTALLGNKVGITSLFEKDGRQLPCTVVKAGPCYVVQKRTEEKDGYKAVQLGYDEIPARKLNKPEAGHLAKAGVKPLRHLKEFKLSAEELQVGDEINVEQFKKGDKVRISGTSIGRGFQGVVKRHHFGGVGMSTHGQSDRQRHPGSIGSSSYPSRVFKGLRMAGRMGHTRITIRNVEILDVLPEQNLILLKGSIPGAKNSLLEIVKQ